MIGAALCQVGQKIVVDPELAIELLKGKKIPSDDHNKKKAAKAKKEESK